MENIQNSKKKITLLTGLVTVAKKLADNIYSSIKDLIEISIYWLFAKTIMTSKYYTAEETNKILLDSFQAKNMKYISLNSVLEANDNVSYLVEFLKFLHKFIL
jgi:hypothetical protein